MLSYVAHTLLSWRRIVFETCLTRISDTHVVCIFKNLSRVMSIATFPCSCNIGAPMTGCKILIVKIRSIVRRVIKVERVA